MKAIIIPKGTIINCDKIKIPTTIDKLVIDKDIILKVTYNNEYDEYEIDNDKFNVYVGASNTEELRDLILEDLGASYFIYTSDEEQNTERAQELADTLKEYIKIMERKN